MVLEVLVERRSGAADVEKPAQRSAERASKVDLNRLEVGG
jgi:hypothetical protein